MKTRITSLGGTFELSSFPGEGTHILINLPLEKNPAF